MNLVQPLFDGAVDVVGDIHGEIDALGRLLAKLGYDADGRHPEGRRLVFVGDLADRGPDSPAVVERVMRLVANGCAQCIVGNHELNLMRGAKKHGNEWWTKPSENTEHPMRPVDAEAKDRMTAFFHSLPIALERRDLRVVHACWDAASIAAVRTPEASVSGVLDLYCEHAAAFEHRWGDPARKAELEAERARFNLEDRACEPDFLPAHAHRDAEKQSANLVSVLTSGIEAPTTTPFWAGGKWRMVERVRWWEGYADAAPVVVGHYWRRFPGAEGAIGDKFGPDLFAGVAPDCWTGKRDNVYCIDFSVGGRAVQRHRGESEDVCQLSALRVPEWEVVHDRAAGWRIGKPDGGAVSRPQRSPP